MKRRLSNGLSLLVLLFGCWLWMGHSKACPAVSTYISFSFSWTGTSRLRTRAYSHLLITSVWCGQHFSSRPQGRTKTGCPKPKAHHHYYGYRSQGLLFTCRPSRAESADSMCWRTRAVTCNTGRGTWKWFHLNLMFPSVQLIYKLALLHWSQ